VRAFVTGATGFIGGRLVTALEERAGDVAFAEREARVRHRDVRGCDAVFHCEGADPGATERVLAAAIAARVQRIVVVSSVAAFGDTRGHVVDEGYVRQSRRFASDADELTWRAYEAARATAAAGAPVRIALVGAAYGPGDPSPLGHEVRCAMTGRLLSVGFPAVGVNAVHVDDVVDGLLLVDEHGRDGERYVLGGELTTRRRFLGAAARAAGRTAPRLTVPTALLRLAAPLGRLAPAAASAPELVHASDRATYWASDAKARQELGYAPRDLARGLADTAAALVAA
jgi:dihydroflavonol-4-reductase